MLSLREFIGPAPTIRVGGPIIRNGDCELVQLPSGELRECNGLQDADRIWEEWEQGRCDGK
jgi:hypothetical protein